MKIKVLVLIVAAAVFAVSGCSTADRELSEDPAELMEIYCFSAGKADAHLIYGEDWAVLIDCGEKGFGGDILGYMDAHGIDRIDRLIITHYDKDHVGGAAKVINNTEIGSVYQSNCPKESKEYSKYLEALEEKGIEPVMVRERVSFSEDGVDFTIDPPQMDSYEIDPSNNSSLITEIRFGECSMLFAGDAEDARLDEYIGGGHGRFDLLKVPYHGHFQNSLKAFLESVSAEWAVITSSDEEREDTETLTALKETGTKVFLTRKSAVLVRCDGRHIEVSYDVPKEQSS